MPSDQLARKPQTLGAVGDQQRHYTFRETGEEMPYRLYVPHSYKPGQKLPLVVALHGAGGRQDYFFRAGTQTQDLCDKYNFIFVAPLGYHAFGGYGAMLLPPVPIPGQESRPVDPRRPLWTPAEEARVNARSEREVLNVLALVEKEYAIDTHNVFLMGHSMGGTGAWYLGQKFASRWAAIAPMSSGFGYAEYPLQRLKGMPLLVSAGSDDIAMHGLLAQRQLAQFKAAGLKVEYVEIPGADQMSMLPPMLPKVLQFFAAHKR
jgi:predicted peptidase